MLRLRNGEFHFHCGFRIFFQLSDITLAGIALSLPQLNSILRTLQRLRFNFAPEMCQIDLRQIQLILIRIQFIRSQRTLVRGRAGKIMVIIIFTLCALIAGNRQEYKANRNNADTQNQQQISEHTVQMRMPFQIAVR